MLSPIDFALACRLAPVLMLPPEDPPGPDTADTEPNPPRPPLPNPVINSESPAPAKERERGEVGGWMLIGWVRRLG